MFQHLCLLLPLHILTYWLKHICFSDVHFSHSHFKMYTLSAHCSSLFCFAMPDIHVSVCAANCVSSHECQEEHKCRLNQEHWAQWNYFPSLIVTIDHGIYMLSPVLIRAVEWRGYFNEYRCWKAPFHSEITLSRSHLFRKHWPAKGVLKFQIPVGLGSLIIYDLSRGPYLHFRSDSSPLANPWRQQIFL